MIRNPALKTFQTSQILFELLTFFFFFEISFGLQNEIIPTISHMIVVLVFSCRFLVLGFGLVGCRVGLGGWVLGCWGFGSGGLLQVWVVGSWEMRCCVSGRVVGRRAECRVTSIHFYFDHQTK